jgi:hypothetical protein
MPKVFAQRIGSWSFSRMLKRRWSSLRWCPKSVFGSPSVVMTCFHRDDIFLHIHLEAPGFLQRRADRGSGEFPVVVVGAAQDQHA